ncbi:MAG TPA: cupin domain-containing protein [Steroidobacteraceae bacterium]|nr:cupin domain-containing protein [Steroidobacteraceae bacterium]
MRAQELIRKLGLTPHREGGSFRQVYKSTTQVQGPKGARSAATTIYYLLEHRQFSRWHVVDADEIWHFYEGAPLELFAYEPRSQTLQRHPLHQPGAGAGPGAGPVAGAGARAEPVAVIPAGTWQAAHCLGEYALVGCTVAPGFEYADFHLVSDLADHQRHFAQALRGLEAFL